MAAPAVRRPRTWIGVKLPGIGWVNIESYFDVIIDDNMSIDVADPGGLAKATFGVNKEIRILPGLPIAFWNGLMPVGGGEIEATDPDPATKTTKFTVRGPAETMQDALIYDKTYVLRSPSGAKPMSSIVGVLPAEFNTLHEPQINDGFVIVPIAQGGYYKAATGNGFTFDAGPNNFWKYMACKMRQEVSPGSASWNLYTVASDTPMNIATGSGNVWDVVSSVSNPGTGSVYDIGGAIPGSNRRWADFYYVWSGGSSGIPSADLTFRSYNFLLATNSSYVSYPNSILTVDTVAKDIVANAGIPNISTSTALIGAATLAITELVSNGDNPRKLLERANAAEGMQWRYTPDAIPALEMRQMPTSAGQTARDARWVLRQGEYAIGGGGDSSIADVYNRVQVKWTATDGSIQTTIATLTPDTTVLAQLGRVRTAFVNVSRICTSAEAAGIAALFLREHRRAPIKANLSLTKGYIRNAAGMRCDPTMIQGGDTIRVLGFRDPATGLLTREGIIAGASIQPKNGLATISLDNDATVFDRQMAYFEAKAAPAT